MYPVVSKGSYGTTVAYDWDYAAYSHTDEKIFFLKFCEIKPQTIYETRPLDPVVDAKYDKEGRLVALQFWNPATVLGCDLTDPVNASHLGDANKPALAIRCNHSFNTDTHDIYFMAGDASDLVERQSRQDEDVFFLEKNKLIFGVRITHSSTRIKQQIKKA